MAKIFVSVPILGKPELKMIVNLYQAILSCREHKVRIFFNENDSLISRARNLHLSVFLDEYKDHDYFMSIDSDIEIANCSADNNIFKKLIDHNVDFVGGLYALKNPGAKQCSSVMMGAQAPQYNSGLIEVRWLSSGCWCIKRSAIEKMVQAYPELTYDADGTSVGKKVYGLYIPMLYDLKKEDFPNVTLPFRKYLSEDWAFCERWKSLGGKMYADTSIVLKHIGRHEYTLWNIDPSKNIQPTPAPNPSQKRAQRHQHPTDLTFKKFIRFTLKYCKNQYSICPVETFWLP